MRAEMAQALAHMWVWVLRVLGLVLLPLLRVLRVLRVMFAH